MIYLSIVNQSPTPIMNSVHGSDNVAARPSTSSVKPVSLGSKRRPFKSSQTWRADSKFLEPWPENHTDTPVDVIVHSSILVTEMNDIDKTNTMFVSKIGPTAISTVQSTVLIVILRVADAVGNLVHVALTG